MLSELRVNGYQVWISGTSRLARQDRVSLSHRSSRVAFGIYPVINERELHMQILGCSLRVHNLDGYLEVLYSVGNNGENGRPQPEDAS